jgi:type IV fimbrial biogenesis protein FimT
MACAHLVGARKPRAISRVQGIATAPEIAMPRQPFLPAVTRRPNHGLTLVECLIAVAVACTAVGAVVPSFGRMMETRHLEGAAAQLETDIHYTRSLAVSLNEPLQLRLQQDAGGSCYVVHRGPAQSCSCSSSAAPVCNRPDAVVRSLALPAGRGVQVQANVGSMLFSPLHGTVTPTGTVRLTGREGRRLHVVVNLMGRARSCSPGGAINGYPVC